MFETASTLANVGTQSGRIITGLGQRLRALGFFYLAGICGFGVLGTMATAKSGLEVLILLVIGCVVSGGLGYWGARIWAKAGES